MAQSNNYFKNNPNDLIWWMDNSEEVKGEFIFTFDKKTHFNMFEDYPHKLTEEQKRIFDEENPFWKKFFEDRN